jgi:hypothetical protein
LDFWMIDSATLSDIVHGAFDPLMDNVGFAHVPSGPYSIRFERAPIFLQVDYDVRSHEVPIWIGDGDDAEPPLELTDALRAVGVNATDLVAASIQTSDPVALARMLRRASELVRAYCAPFLQGSRDAFEAARRLRSQRAKAYTEDIRDSHALAAADDAWAKKEYGAVHDLLNPIRDRLDASHRRRLEFAQKHL